MNWFANLLNSAVGPIRGRYLDFEIAPWICWAVTLPCGLLLGVVLYHFGAPIAHKMSDREILWLILISIWWTRK